MKQKLQPDSAYFKLIFFFSLIFLSTNTLKALINISVNTHWHSGNLPPTSLGNDYRTGIFIQSNVELIIDGRSLAMNTGTTIELDLGAHLRLVNNTIITSSSPGTNVTWNGILATGDLLNHFIQEPDTTILDDTTAWQGIINPDETYVGIFNSTISSAYYGVYSDRGAIVRARNSTFSDNGTGVYIKYSINEKCATYFMDCNFLWTKTNSNLVQTNLTGISLENSNNINIGGCTFTNNDVGLHCTDERGTGIKAAGASFNLSKSGNTFCKDALYCFENCYQSGSPTPVSQSNSFTNLSKGIEVTQGPGSSFRWAYVARQSVFQDNFIAISSNSTENSKVYKCTFSGSRSALAYFFNTTCLTSTTMINHIIFTDDLDWEAYDNTFSFTGAYINHIKAPGYTFAQSRIQMNTFTNSNTSTVASNQVNGIYVSNTNAYMEIYCNTFTNMGTDINLVAGGTVIDPLGSNTLPAENVFLQYLWVDIELITQQIHL